MLDEINANHMRRKSAKADFQVTRPSSPPRLLIEDKIGGLQARVTFFNYQSLTIVQLTVPVAREGLYPV